MFSTVPTWLLELIYLAFYNIGRARNLKLLALIFFSVKIMISKKTWTYFCALCQNFDLFLSMKLDYIYQLAFFIAKIFGLSVRKTVEFWKFSIKTIEYQEFFKNSRISGFLNEK